MRHLRLVNEFCTCGARLPEDARFCHKCGKPQREEPEIEALAREAEPTVEVEAAPIPTATAPPALSTIGFRNPVAVRAAVIASAFATHCRVDSVSRPFPFAVAARYDCRGWIRVGVLISAPNWRLSVVARRPADRVDDWPILFHCDDGHADTSARCLRRCRRERTAKITAESGRPEIAEVFSGMLTNPAMLVFALVSAFFVMTVLASAGGALGSKVLDKE